MTTRKSVKAVKLRPDRAWVMGYGDDADLYIFVSTMRSNPKDAWDAGTDNVPKATREFWRRNGYRVIPVTISPRGK